MRTAVICFFLLPFLVIPASPAQAAAPVVDSLVAGSTVVAPGGTTTLQVDAHDPDCAGTCTSGCGMFIRSDLTQWSADGGTFNAEDDGTLGSPYTATAEWQAPVTEGTYTLQVLLSDSASFTCGGRQSTTASIEILVAPVLDFGDAPDPAYPTLLANDGARHVATGIMLGSSRDDELDGQPSANADGDDASDTDDEDGVVFTSPYIPGDTVSLEVTVSASGLLNAWVDFNLDGDWMDTGEQVFTDQAVSAGVNALGFNVPATASTTTPPYARFRVDSSGGLTTTGRAEDGEVEDHLVIGTTPDNGGGGGGGGGSCGTIAQPGDGPSGPLQLALWAMLLWGIRRASRLSANSPSRT